MLSLFLATLPNLPFLPLPLPPFSVPLGVQVGRGCTIGAGLKGTVGVGVIYEESTGLRRLRRNDHQALDPKILLAIGT